MYVLGESPRTPNEAFDALENVFSSEEFSVREAQTVLEEVLDVSPSEARNEVNRLLRMRAIEEV